MDSLLRYRRARLGIWLSAGVGLAYNTLGTVFLGLYIVMVFGDLFVGLSPITAIGTIIVAYISSWIFAVSLTRHGSMFYLPSPSLETASRPIPVEVTRDVFNLPYVLALTTILTWGVFGMLLYGLIPHATEHEAQRHFVHIFWSIVFSTNVVAVCVLYHSENILWFWGSLDYSLQGRSVSSIPGLWSVPVWFRLAVFFITSAFLPIAFIWELFSRGELTQKVFLFAIASALSSGFLQAGFIIFNISGAIGRIAARFREFRSSGVTSRPTRVWRADALGQLAEMLDEFMSTHKERERIRSTFGRYVSEKVVDKILSSDVETQGARTHATVMFVDVRGFTTLSETLPPEIVVEILNAYLETMVRAITAHEGMPDKFIGDGILAVWGVPLPDPHCEVHATQAALVMLDSLRTLNQHFLETGRPTLRIGIGLHAGDVVAGSIGSQQKLEYTVIGDTVNTCARIESATKELNVQLALSSTVWTQLPPELQNRFSAAPSLRLKGKTLPVELYVLRDES